MANNTSQRMAAFLLAFMFLLTTVGAAVFVVFEINSEEGGLVETTTPTAAELAQAQQEAAQPVDLGTIDNFDGPVEVAELRFEDTVAGEGDEVQTGASVTIEYTGALASTGAIFDSSVGNDPVTFDLDSLIPGWQEGIPGMKVGGTRRLFIPSAQGYGAAGSGANIPPDSDLIFDIELFATEPEAPAETEGTN